MIIKITTEHGWDIFYTLPLRLTEKIQSISVVEELSAPELPVVPVVPLTKPKIKLADISNDWSGLWLTEKDSFVEVVSNEEAYFLRENGTRMVKGSINNSGIIVVDGTEVCHLQERRRGVEATTTKIGKIWPTPLGR